MSELIDRLMALNGARPQIGTLMPETSNLSEVGDIDYSSNFPYPTRNSQVDGFKRFDTVPTGGTGLGAGAPVGAYLPDVNEGLLEHLQKFGPGSTPVSTGGSSLGKWWGDLSGKEKFGIGKDLLGILGGFGQGYLGYQQNKLAKRSQRFQENAFNKNYGNQVQAYNTSLENRFRTAETGKGNTNLEADLAAYLQKNRLT